MSSVSTATELLAINRAEQTHFKCRCSIICSAYVDTEYSNHRNYAVVWFHMNNKKSLSQHLLYIIYFQFVCCILQTVGELGIDIAKFRFSKKLRNKCSLCSPHMLPIYKEVYKSCSMCHLS